MSQYLVFIVLKGSKTKKLKGHIVPRELLQATQARPWKQLQKAILKKRARLKKMVSR